MKRIVHLFAAIAAIAVSASPAFAHSTVKSTVPASGSILPASPAEIAITFNESARLTSVIVVQAGKPDRKLEATSSESSTSFKLMDPKLENGRNEIRWTALSKDGHPISGSIIVVIKPGAAPSAPASQPDHHQGHG